MAEWISTKERLPERGENVLCCGLRGGMYVGWIDSQTQDDKEKGKALTYMYGSVGRYATHWMPLPDRPMEGKND